MNPNELKERLEERGVILIKGACSSFIPELRDIWETGFTDMADKLGLEPEELNRLVSTFDRQNSTVQALVGLVKERLFDMLHKLSGVAVEPVDFSVFLKSSNAPGATHAHQDMAYRWNRPDKRYSLTSWIALDDADENSGALEFIPGSHRHPVEVRQDHLNRDFVDRRKTEAWKLKARTMAVQAGDVLVFDARTWHAAWPTNGRKRRALIIRWQDSELLRRINVPKPDINPDCFGMDTAGALLVKAIRHVVPDYGARVGEGIENALEFLLAARPDLLAPEHSRIQDIMQDLRRALIARRVHGGRVNSDIWKDVREELIPELYRISPLARQQKTTPDWMSLKPSSCGTYHLDQHDSPAYAARFDEVLAFHPPGLAPVRRGEDAWHIHPDGNAAYARRFLRTFGFYDGLAAVVADEGWHHINPQGEDAYPQRYAWCGNFQGGRCSVRRDDGAYAHIKADGAPAYAERWRYVGDFRDGIAVVQADSGRSTHIDPRGQSIHGRWFLDLDVFHKGFARARDDGGWLHVDKSGQPTYQRRFAAVEPFYNGQARVERHDGGLEVIDEQGVTLRELRPALRSEFAALSGDMTGFWRSQTIAAAVALGIFEALPGSADGIARRCRLQADQTLRLLRGLAELNLVEAEANDWFCTTRGDYLRADHPLSLASAAREYGEFFPRMWAELPAAIRGTRQTPRIFAEVAANPERRAAHHRMLRGYARHDYADVPKTLALQGNERVIDAGGGLGVLAAALLATYPALHVTLLERPEVIAQAAGELPSDPRLTLRAGDMFSAWPDTADAVLLARVLHDWDDEAALHILQRARAALPQGGRLFIVEMLLSEDNPAGALCDLHLLMATGGRERSAAEYRALLARAGFAFKEVRELAALPAIIVGEAR